MNKKPRVNFNALPSPKTPLDMAADNARSWRDAALAAPLAPVFAIGQQWAALCAEFEEEPDTTGKIEVAQRAAVAMRKRSDDLRQRLRPHAEYQAEYEADRVALHADNAAKFAARPAPPTPAQEPAADIADAFSRRGIRLAIGHNGKLQAHPAKSLTAADKEVLAHRADDLLAHVKSEFFEVAATSVP